MDSKSLTCEAVILTAVSPAAVIKPLPFTVKLGTVAASPKLPTLELTVANVAVILGVDVLAFNPNAPEPDTSPVILNVLSFNKAPAVLDVPEVLIFAPAPSIVPAPFIIIL